MATLNRCIVIGASAGGYDLLRQIASQLPADLPVPVFIVLHVAAYEPSLLPDILSNSGPLPAVHPSDGACIEAGTIYVAPPDHHLLIDEGRVAVKKGPKENRFRPSIDALFRSAAYSYGSGAIGVVLSGALNDGTSGLWSIKRLGGIAIVQDPLEALYPSMPHSALEYVQPDYKVQSAEIASLLTSLVREPMSEEAIAKEHTHEDMQRMDKELQVAAGVKVPAKIILELGPVSPFTCPECQGPLVKITEGNLSRFRCHTGHAFTDDSLLAGVTEKTEEMIWQTMRGFQEASILLEYIGANIQEAGESAKSQLYFDRARELNNQATKFQQLALEHESLSRNYLEREQASD